ncbi:MAG: hypothetical protein IJI57_16585 [Flexilinea sp.]|nr:hypothetical protein [Flexilinea sp.]
MFRRQNRHQGQNIQNNQEPRILNEEQGPGGIGNEALAENIAGGLVNLISNEANAKALENEIPEEITKDRLDHYYQNDLTNDKLNKSPRDIRQYGLENYYQNDLNNLEMKPAKRKRRKEDDINRPLIPVDDDPINIPENNPVKPKKKRAGGMTEKELPDSDDEELIIEKAPEIIENILEKDPGLDASLSDKSSVSGKNKKGKKSPPKKSAPKKAAPKGAAPQKEEDLTQIDKSLEPVQGWDYTTERVPVQKLPERKKQGFGSKVVSALAFYGGKTIGKLGGILATIVKSIYDLFRFGKLGTLGGTWKRLFGIGKLQRRGNRNLIPGWDGAEFENAESENKEEDTDEVQADFRRVPEIWSVPTADKATEGDNDDDRNAKPRDPVISVYIAQGSKKYTVTDDGSTGHSGIGVEYSRYNARAGRWFRYKLRFGFFTGGGMSGMSTLAVTSYNNATIPGQVLDENGRGYDISRSYPAKPKQVSAVLRAAESYADRGGYNAYTRNCTTFAKEMIVDVAKIKGAESVFAKDEIYLQKKADAKMLGAAAMAPIFKADMENIFAKNARKDDIGYQNFGNKMLSKEDYERYNKSLSWWSGKQCEADSPNAVAENMRRAEGGGSGTIGSFHAEKNGNKTYRQMPISLVFQNLVPLFTDLKQAMDAITPMDKLMEGGMTPELKKLRGELNGTDLFTKLVTLLPQQDEINFKLQSKQSNLKKARILMTDTIKNLNILLFRYYRNDKRIQEKVLPIINTLNHGINAVDFAYAKTENKDLTDVRDSDLGNIVGNFSKEKFSFHIDQNKSVEMTPSEYEAWLQIFKTQQEALKQFARFNELEDKDEDKNARLTDAESKDLQRLRRINMLSKDFERSHRYMLEKDQFSQQDIDYAFSLGYKEQLGGIQSDMLEKGDENDPTMSLMSNPNASASGIYKMLIMKTVFGGMKDRFKQQFPDGNNTDEMSAWLANDTLNCIRNHKKETTMILRGLKNFLSDKDKQTMLQGFSKLLTKWMFQLFHGDQKLLTYSQMVKAVTDPKGIVMQEIDTLATSVLQEEQAPAAKN